MKTVLLLKFQIYIIIKIICNQILKSYYAFLKNKKNHININIDLYLSDINTITSYL